ncbi:MAG: MaoC/PaaZ C-terminal domain-containing protein [Acidimicrobiales bacterium]
MAIPTALAGLTVTPMTHHVDARWTMAYAAALGDHRPAYMDTLRAEGVVAHPLFAVCPEWPVIVSSRAASEERGVSPDEVITSVHAGHDTTIHRLIRPGDVLTASLEVVGLVSRPPGAMSLTRLETVDGDGRPVTSTTQSGIYLAVPAEGDDVPDPAPPAPVEGVERRGDPVTTTVALAAGAAHTYTECARIWNPIHTDRAVAQRAGLPDIILHGTANLAHGVTAVIDSRAEGRPELVRRVVCRFAAMVPLPSTLHIRVWPANDTGRGRSTVPFEVLNDAGAPAVKDGLVVLGEPGRSEP